MQRENKERLLVSETPPTLDRLNLSINLSTGLIHKTKIDKIFNFMSNILKQLDDLSSLANDIDALKSNVDEMTILVQKVR